jgi:hypothetical protein
MNRIAKIELEIELYQLIRREHPINLTELEKIADELIFVVKTAAQDYSDEEFGK